MSRHVRALVLLLSSSLLMMAHESLAGVNAGGAARLSWDQAGTTDLSVVPSTPFPLFLFLDGVTDVRSLAVSLRWTPFDSVGCYAVVSAAADTGCAWAVADPPGGDFEGDSTYTWSIVFDPTDADRRCVVFWVSRGTCPDAVPANFCLDYVKVKDSSGAVDDLAVLGGATLLGGPSTACPMFVEDATPHYLARGLVNTLTIHGRNFQDGASVQLRGTASSIVASSVARQDASTLVATASLPDSVQGPLDVIVGLPDGQTATLQDGVTTGDFWWGIMVDSTTVFTGRVGSGTPLYQQDVATGAVTPIDEPTTTESYSDICNNVPLCTIPFFGQEFHQPSVGSGGTNCPKLQLRTSQTSITYFFCYHGPCYPGVDYIVRNLDLEFKQFARQITGGHCHADTTRPAGTPRNGAIAAGNTGANGLGFAVNHVFPEVSGAQNVIVYTPPGQDTLVINAAKDTLYIFCTRWAQFAQLTGPGPGYKLQAPGADNLQRHPDYHWGKPQMIDDLKRLAAAIRDSLPGLPDVEYNDISLVWGGMFDILDPGTSRPPDWTLPHCSHRFGTGVDFRTRNLPTSDSELATRLKKLMKDYGFWVHKEGDHWHLNYVK